MKDKITTQILMTVAILIVSFNSFGSSCRTAPQVSDDMRDFAKLVTMKIDGKPAMLHAAFKPKSETEFYKIDLSQIDNGETRSLENMKILDGTGIVTREKDVLLGSKTSGYQEVANSIAISSCHVLVNFHGVDKFMGGVIGQPKLKEKDRFWVHLGQGAICQGNGAFKESKAGQIVAMGSQLDSEDWAIIKLDRKLEKVKPVETLDSDVDHVYPDDNLLLAGRDAKSSVADGGFQHLHAKIVSNKFAGGQVGTFGVSNLQFQPGLSGAGAYKKSQGSLKLSAIFLGENRMLTVEEIAKQMSASKKYQSVYDDIANDKCD